MNRRAVRGAEVEMRNLAGDSTHRAELDRLYLALKNWVRDTHDPATKPPDNPPLTKL